MSKSKNHVGLFKNHQIHGKFTAAIQGDIVFTKYQNDKKFSLSSD